MYFVFRYEPARADLSVCYRSQRREWALVQAKAAKRKDGALYWIAMQNKPAHRQEVSR